ncbi:MAG: hypothetical protein RIF33_05935 [Cyclobacteriaceae bacterium]
MKTLKIFLLGIISMGTSGVVFGQLNVPYNGSRSYFDGVEVGYDINNSTYNIGGALKLNPGDGNRASLTFDNTEVYGQETPKWHFNTVENGNLNINSTFFYGPNETVPIAGGTFQFTRDGDLEVPRHLIVNGDILDEQGERFLGGVPESFTIANQGNASLYFDASSVLSGTGIDRYVIQQYKETDFDPGRLQFLFQKDHATTSFNPYLLAEMTPGSFDIHNGQLKLTNIDQDGETNGLVFSKPLSGDGDADIFSIGANDLDFGAGNNTILMRLSGSGTTDGNLGIGNFVGNEQPEQKLHVKDGDFLLENNSSSLKITNEKHGDAPAFTRIQNSEKNLWIGAGTNVQMDFRANGPVQIRHHSDTEFHGYSGDVDEAFSVLVQRGILSQDFAIADPTQWADYVFAEDYELSSLEDMEAYLQENKHLPGIISESEIEEQGFYQVADVMVGQLKNLEEQVLHNIAQEKKITAQQRQLKIQAEKLRRLELLVDQLIGDK